jgi:enterochelin esterase-like enzyme
MLERILPTLLLHALALLLPGASALAGQTPTYSVAGTNDSPTISSLRRQLNSENTAAAAEFWRTISDRGAPLIEPIPAEPNFSFVTFLWHGDNHTRNVVIFDGVAGFDARDRMLHIDGTNIWYKTYRVRNDARFAYNLSPNDSLQPFDDVKGDEAMRARLAMLRVDPLNPHRCPTTFGAYGTDSSYVELPGAPPLIWNSSIAAIPRGSVEVKQIHSDSLNIDKKIWVYTPPGFGSRDKRYPLLVLFDGDRNVLWMPKLLDILIAERKIPPMLIVMTDESTPSVRNSELPCNPRFASFLANELVPWTRRNYFATTSADQTVVAGSSYGGLASIYAALKFPEVFGNAIALSGSFFWKPQGDQASEWLVRLVRESPTQRQSFYLEVGLMESFSMEIKPNEDMRDALRAKGHAVGYSEFDGGHSFLTWSNGMANGLEFVFRK